MVKRKFAALRCAAAAPTGLLADVQRLPCAASGLQGAAFSGRRRRFAVMFVPASCSECRFANIYHAPSILHDQCRCCFTNVNFLINGNTVYNLDTSCRCDSFLHCIGHWQLCRHALCRRKSTWTDWYVASWALAVQRRGKRIKHAILSLACVVWNKSHAI